LKCNLSLLLRVSNGETDLMGVVGGFARPGNKVVSPDLPTLTTDDFVVGCAAFVEVKLLVILFASLVGFDGNGFLPVFFLTFISSSGAGFNVPNESAACFNFGVGLCSRGVSVGVRMPCVFRTTLG